MRKILVKVVSVLWALLLVSLLLPDSSGALTLHTFLKPDLWWLVSFGALIYFTFLLVPYSECGCGHNHVKSRLGAFVKPLILLAPIPFIVAFGDAEYGSDGLSTRLVKKNLQLKTSTASVTGPELIGRDTTALTDFLKLSNEPESFIGRRVKTIGMLYQDGQGSEDHLLGFRYVMSCCAADAMPVGVLINKPEGFVLEKDAWYEFEGIVKPDSIEGYFVVKMDDVLIRQIEKPSQTWLYP
jgi:uncharacterized repeat protein (TIGR03943 family)